MQKITGFVSKNLYFITAIVAVGGTIFYLFNENLRYLPLFYLVLGHLALGLLVYSHNPRNKINVSYTFLVFFTGGMIAANAIFYELSQMNDIILAARMIYVFTFALMVPLAFFSSYFPFEKPKLSLMQKILIVIPASILAPLTMFTDLMVKNVIVNIWTRQVVFGPLFYVFSAYCAGFIIYSFFVLMLKHGMSSGLQKTQIRYMFISFMIIGVPMFSANILLPLTFNNYGFIEPSLYFALPEAALAAYAVLKHRLMSVEIVIQRGFVYTSATALIMMFYILAVIVSETFFRNYMGYSSVLITAGATLLIAVVYQPLVGIVRGITDRLFFRERYDYQKTLRKISHEIASVIKLEELTKLIVSSFVETMKVSEISFLLLDRDREHFRSVSLSVPRYKKIEIDAGNPIVYWLSSVKDILVRDEIEDEIARLDEFGGDASLRLKLVREVKDSMERLGILVWVPIVSKDDLIGIIALGNKLSGEVFTSEDIGLLSTLANQTSVALDNARLYEEVVNMKDYNEEILQSMVSGVMTVDIKGRIITFNNMAEKITVRRAADVIGKTCREVWGDRGSITGVVEDTLKREKRYINHESGVVSQERGMVPVAFSSVVLFDHKKKKIGVLLTISDLTGVRELEEKVRRADKLSALATMAAGMAHEIKNPLSSMKVLSQLLPIKFADVEFRGKFIEIMPREISRIDRIVESLLGFARATSPKYEKLKIEDVIEENVKYYREQAKSANIKINTVYAPLPEIYGDHDQLSQVFSNLILNAVQAMPDGGEVNVVTKEGRKIEDILQEVVVEVADQGHGISPQNLQKLFDPFFTTKYAGTGLGLTIVHNVVDGHRGSIDVRSKPGKGTTFVITLPVGQELI